MFYFKDLQKEECDFLRGVPGADETQIIKFIDSGQHSMLMSRRTKWTWSVVYNDLLLHLPSSSPVYHVPLSILTGWNQHSLTRQCYWSPTQNWAPQMTPVQGQQAFTKTPFPGRGSRAGTWRCSLTLKMFFPWMAVILKLARAFLPTVPRPDVDAFIVFLMWFHQINLKDISSLLRRIWYFIGQPHYCELHNELIQTLSHIQTHFTLTKLFWFFGYCVFVEWNHNGDDVKMTGDEMPQFQPRDWIRGKLEWFLGFTFLDLSFVPLNGLCL